MLVVLAALLGVHLAAQQMGQIVGVVRDASGGLVPGVTVTATEAQTGYKRAAGARV